MSYPWVWMMHEALRLGLSADDFWRMSARAVCLLIEERARCAGSGRAPGREAPKRSVSRLNYLPRP